MTTLPCRGALALLVCLAAGACKKESPPEPGSAAPAPGGGHPASITPSAPVAIDDPQACAPCHGVIVAEWATSQHAVAHDDPIFLALLGLRKTREGDDLASKCASCHMPRVAERGVTCAACHAHTVAVGSRGGQMSGPHDLAAGASAAHATGPAAREIVDGVTLCLRCHEVLENAAGVPTCSTGIEWRAVAGAASCASCHMPEASGPGVVGSPRATHRAHRFVGPHARHGEDAAHALAPVELTVGLEATSAVVTLRNTAPHRYPTGFPARTVVVELVGLDAAGAEVWRNFRANPMDEAPDAVLNTVFVDDKGEPTLAPWSVAMKRDSRLAAGETRTLRVEVPRTVKTVRVRVLARLMAPILAEKVALKDSPLAAPKVVASGEASR